MTVSQVSSFVREAVRQKTPPLVGGGAGGLIRVRRRRLGSNRPEPTTRRGAQSDLDHGQVDPLGQFDVILGAMLVPRLLEHEQ